tara:strand:- start:2334 stop:3155 length:822 start_codon:yes stop_codon:yes gene_type:complete
MAKKDKSLSLFEKDQDMISGIGAKAAMDAGIADKKSAIAKLQDNPAIKEQLRKSRVAKDQVAVRAQSRKDNARLEAERQAKLKARDDAKKNTVDYSDATKPKGKPAKKFNVGVSKGGVSFKDAFKHFKDKGSKTFTWNGKKYTTQTADEKKSGSSSKADAPAKKTFRQRRAANLKAKIADENVGEGRKRRLKRRLGRVERRMAQGKADGGEMVKGYYQGGSARLDESLGERQGKESTKSQSMKSRRNESRGATKKSTPKSAGTATRGWGAVIR